MQVWRRMEVGGRVTVDEARAFLRDLGATKRALGGQVRLGADAAGWLLAPPEARLARPDRVEWVAAGRYVARARRPSRLAIESSAGETNGLTAEDAERGAERLIAKGGGRLWIAGCAQAA